MGRISTPKYVVEMDGSTPSPWHGRLPSADKLRQYVMEYVVSTYPGFCNEHIGQQQGISIPRYARIVCNDSTHEVMVEWTAAAITALPDAAQFPRVACALQTPHTISNSVPTPEEMGEILGLSPERVAAVRRIMDAAPVKASPK